MEGKYELEDIDIKNLTCAYLNDIITDSDIYSLDILLNKRYMKIFQFMIFHTKLSRVKNYYVSGSIKKIDLLGLVAVNFNILYYLIMDCLIKFVIRLNIL